MYNTKLDNGLLMPTTNKKEEIIKVKEFEKISKYDDQGHKLVNSTISGVSEQINEFIEKNNITPQNVVNIDIQPFYDQNKHLLIEKCYLTYRLIK